MFGVSVLVAVLIAGSSRTVYPPAGPPAKLQTPTAAEQEPIRPLSVPKDYKYNPRGRRDPFINPVPKPVEKSAPPPTAASIRPPGLKGVLIADATIAGVVTSSDPMMTIVVLGAPGGNRYFARVGDALYDAIVREIRIDTVKFALTAPGGGNREIVRPVRPTSGENK